MKTQSINPIVARNVQTWRKTHRVCATAAESEARLHRIDRYAVRNGRLVSVAQALAHAKAA